MLHSNNYYVIYFMKVVRYLPGSDAGNPLIKNNILDSVSVDKQNSYAVLRLS